MADLEFPAGTGMTFYIGLGIIGSGALMAGIAFWRILSMITAPVIRCVLNWLSETDVRQRTRHWPDAIRKVTLGLHDWFIVKYTLVVDPGRLVVRWPDAIRMIVYVLIGWFIMVPIGFAVLSVS